MSYTSADVTIRAWILSSYEIIQNDKYIYQKDVTIFRNQVPITSIFNPDSDIVVIQVCLIYASLTLKKSHDIYIHVYFVADLVCRRLIDIRSFFFLFETVYSGCHRCCIISFEDRFPQISRPLQLCNLPKHASFKPYVL